MNVVFVTLSEFIGTLIVIFILTPLFIYFATKEDQEIKNEKLISTINGEEEND